MSITIEMIFSCIECGTERQYGLAPNLRFNPANPLPTIDCAGNCGQAKKHIFVRDEIRSPRRDEEIRRTLRAELI